MTIRTFAGLGSEAAPPPTGDIYSDDLIPGGSNSDLKGRVAVPFATENGFTWSYDPGAAAGDEWELQTAGGGLNANLAGDVNAYAVDLGQTDHWVEIVWETVGTSTNTGVALGLNPGSTMACYFATTISATRARVYSFDGASETSLMGNMDSAYVSGMKMRLERVGNQLTFLISDDGIAPLTQRGQVTNVPSGWTPGNYCGVYKGRGRNTFMRSFRCGPMP